MQTKGRWMSAGGWPSRAWQRPSRPQSAGGGWAYYQQMEESVGFESYGELIHRQLAKCSSLVDLSKAILRPCPLLRLSSQAERFRALGPNAPHCRSSCYPSMQGLHHCWKNETDVPYLVICLPQRALESELGPDAGHYWLVWAAWRAGCCYCC